VSSAPTVLQVDSVGHATALAPGAARVIVSYKKRADTLDVTVGVPAVATVTLSATKLTLPVTQATTLGVNVRDAGGHDLPWHPVSLVSSDLAILTVDSAGIVRGNAAGTATVRASAGGVSSAPVAFTVTAAPPPPPPPPPPTGSVTPPAAPQLLQFSYPSVSGRSWVVQSGANLQTVLNSAQRGDEIVLQAGASFTGNFLLPAKAGTAADGWIVIRSDQPLPPQGTRVTPADAPRMARIVTANTQPALATAAKASGWWLSGVEVTIAPSVTAINYGLLSLGNGSETVLANVPSDLVVDRAIIRGLPTSKVSRCIALNSARTSIQDSYVHECHLKGFDSQAILGWNGPGPFKIVNNTLAGAGENIMFGGADPKIAGLIPSDIEVRRNYIVTPISWKGVWTKKNIFELKSARRVLLEGNVLDGSWSDGQTGFAVVLKVANQSGSCTWCTTSDVTIRKNIIRNVGAGFSIMGKQGGSPNPVGALLDRLLIEHNVVENVNAAPYLGEARMVSVMNDVQNMAIVRNTMTAPGALQQFLNLASVPAGTNFLFEQNIVSYGNYGFFSSWYGIGESSMKGFNGTKSFASVVIIGNARSGYPNAQFVSTLAAAQATGFGASSAQVTAATAGVVIP
jgi:hypothetical protein